MIALTLFWLPSSDLVVVGDLLEGGPEAKRRRLDPGASEALEVQPASLVPVPACASSDGLGGALSGAGILSLGAPGISA